MFIPICTSLIDQLGQELTNHLVGRFSLTIYIEIINGGGPVLESEMLYQMLNRHINEVSSLVPNQCQMTTVSGENLLI
jgi:hypothetical protein